MMADDTEPTVARFWTGARRFPRLIGKTVNGDRIPGGPYTITQAIGGTLTVWILWETRPVWGPGQIIAELLFIAGMGWCVLWALGKVPIQTRNPMVLVAGIAQAMFAPREGRLAGSPRVFRTRAHRMPLFNPPAPIYNDAHAAALASVANLAKPAPRPAKPAKPTTRRPPQASTTRRPLQASTGPPSSGHPGVPVSFAEELRVKAEAWKAEPHHEPRERTPVG